MQTEYRDLPEHLQAAIANSLAIMMAGGRQPWHPIEGRLFGANPNQIDGKEPGEFFKWLHSALDWLDGPETHGVYAVQARSKMPAATDRVTTVQQVKAFVPDLLPVLRAGLSALETADGKRYDAEKGPDAPDHQWVIRTLQRLAQILEDLHHLDESTIEAGRAVVVTLRGPKIKIDDLISKLHELVRTSEAESLLQYIESPSQPVATECEQGNVQTILAGRAVRWDTPVSDEIRRLLGDRLLSPSDGDKLIAIEAEHYAE